MMNALFIQILCTTIIIENARGTRTLVATTMYSVEYLYRTWDSYYTGTILLYYYTRTYSHSIINNKAISSIINSCISYSTI